MNRISLHDDFIHQLTSLLAEDGFSLSEIIKQAITNGNITHNLQSETETLRLMEVLVASTGDSSLMIRWGQRIDIASLGTFGFALMSSANLNEALRLLLRYQTITGPGPAFELHENHGNVMLRLRINTGSPTQQRLLKELTFSQIISMGQFLVSEAIEGAELDLSYAPPAGAQRYSELLSVAVNFQQPHSQLVIPKTIMGVRIRTANPATHVIFQQQCEDLLRSLNRVENFSSAVRRLLINAGGAFPDIKKVAADLFVSERTLNRRLQAETTSFRTICDEVRNLLACQYLTTTALTMTEIASLLGYTEAASFRRAFARWHTVTPGQFRREYLTN